tara:strand:+ start:548 stop:949 length:402 start_codon:yes stop_codon:yes gene_type:complete
MRILRESNEYSQEYVANVLNISQKTYSSLESGKTKITLNRIQELADLYKVKPEYFLSEDLPIVNYNTGTYSRSVIAKNSYEEKNDVQSQQLFERIIKEKEIHISHLVEELAQLKKEKMEIFELLRANLSKTKQ